VIKNLLSRFGIAVTTVENGEQAVNLVAQETFDLIFMDCQMPVMDGFEATRLIRIWEQGRVGARTLPIVALTANALAGDREICLAAGMTDYLTKPVTGASVTKVLDRHLSAMPPMIDTSAEQSVVA
jgi:CheY-like chemotaxis protein